MKKVVFPVLCCFALLINCSKGGDITSSPDTNANLKAGNLLSTGASARDLLSNDTFDKLLIEIDYVNGFAPTAGAIANFEEFLRARTFKEDIEFKYTALSSPNEETLTLDEIVDLEKENRDEYNNGSTLAIHIYFADAPADSDEEDENLVTLGAVYRNTSMVIYESTVKDIASRSTAITTEDVETATILHEFGHLFGLINLSTESVNDHEDSESDNHCNVDGCLMRAELEFGASLLKEMKRNTSKGLAAVPSLGPECLLDVKKYGGR
ncbi:hypothetical protein K1F50_11330 [Muricauda oceani]|uniref:Membrane metalloprotease n=1 Tax=Flagellimonas oceani TaxID=2698672 RepID=A0A6G7J415_9FLAO|nr:hypothetical protein [Allomuricauda oceani]MBW8243394.1 hypothetical protein [Allomuricauda oceani]QII45613.1 hypothetical protein GVT53_13310 [Allomuricauda oceani]